VPAIIHSTPGKDRVGIASAFLLLLLGVSEDTLIDDYTISNIYFPEILNQAEKRYQEHEFFTSLLNMKAIDLQVFYLAKAETLKKLIQYINNKYGSIDNFLLDKAKIDNATIDSLRKRFLKNNDEWEIHGPHQDMNYQVYIGPAYRKKECFLVAIYPKAVYEIDNYDDWWKADPEKRITI